MDSHTITVLYETNEFFKNKFRKNERELYEGYIYILEYIEGI